MDPDPVFFLSDLQDANNILSFFTYYFLKIHLHHASEIKSHKELKKTAEFKIFVLFLLDDGRFRIRIRTSD
jgi:hypothetical protein